MSNLVEQVTQNLISTFKELPVFSQAEEQRRKRIAAERSELIAKEAALRAKQEAEWIANSKVFNKANEKFDAIKKQYAAAEAEWSQAYRHRLTTNLSFNAQCDQVKAQLWATAPSVFEEARRWILAELDSMRRGWDIGEEKTDLQDYAGNRVTLLLTNRKDWRERREALNAAFRKLEELEFTVASYAEAIQKIDEIKAAIPAMGPVVKDEGGSR